MGSRTLCSVIVALVLMVAPACAQEESGRIQWYNFEVVNARPGNVMHMHEGVWKDVAEVCLGLAPGTYPDAHSVTWYAADSIVALDNPDTEEVEPEYYAYGLTVRERDPESGELVATAVVIEVGQWFEPWVISHEGGHVLAPEDLTERTADRCTFPSATFWPYRLRPKPPEQ